MAEVKADVSSLTWLQGLWLLGRARLTGLLASRGFLTLADQAVASATNFLTGVIIGRACAKEEFGLYLLGFSLVFLILPLQTSLISGPYSVYSPRLQGRAQNEYAGSTLVQQLGFTALAVVLLLGAGVVCSRGLGPPGLGAVAFTLAAAIAFILLKEYGRQFSFAHLNSTTALVLDAAAGLVQVGGLLLLAHWGFLSASRALGMVGLASGLAGLVWLLSHRRRFTLRLTQALADLRRHWAFGKWLFATRVLSAASNQLYPWLLVFFHGPAATGAMAACLGTIFLANPFLMGMGNYLGPKAAHAYVQGGPSRVRRLVGRDTLVMAVVMLPFCGIMLLWGGEVLTLMYGPKYAGYGLAVGLFALSQLSSGLAIPLTSGLLALERPEVGFKSSCLSLVVMLGLGLWLVKSFGLEGAAVGALLGRLVMSLYQWLVFQKAGPRLREEPV